MTLEQLRRVRHGARAALTLGVTVSIVANILHAANNLISQSIAAWAPLALLLTIELIARVPVRRGRLSLARLLATATIAGIAAWVSYWHMVGVALRYGEEPGAAHLIPLTVDGLVVVAWVCLVELGGRIRDAQTEGERDEYEARGREAGNGGGQEVLRPASVGLQGADRPGREQGEGPGRDPQGAEEGAAAGVKLIPSRKPHASSAERVVRAHNRTPDATHEEIARRLKLSVPTVKRHRPPAPTNGRVPDFEDAHV